MAKRKLETYLPPELYDTVEDNLPSAVQEACAATLRKMAIEHLAKDKGTVARSFRGEYCHTGAGPYQSFLQRQSKTGAWGTYIEASALAEKFMMNLVVTPVTHGVASKPICLYRSDDPSAPTIQLFNDNNVHWRSATSNQHTAGNGNCLYNAVALELKTMEAQEPALDNLPVNAEVIKSQKTVLQAINSQPTASEVSVDFEAEKARIENLPIEEQRQIELDHSLALRLAAEELRHVGTSFPGNCAAEAQNEAQHLSVPRYVMTS